MTIEVPAVVERAHERMQARAARVWEAAGSTPDPELPTLTIADLGILRGVELHDNRVVAVITPTYSGCPAMREISASVEARLRAAGFEQIEVRTRLTPPWTSDWITETGRAKLAATGIAAPVAAPLRSGPTPLTLMPTRVTVACPQCGSDDTVRTAQFSGTACKALYRCARCSEPFEYVKEI